MNVRWLVKNVFLLGIALVFLHISLTTISQMTGEPSQDIPLLAIASVLLSPSLLIIFHFLEIKNYKSIALDSQEKVQ